MQSSAAQKKVDAAELLTKMQKATKTLDGCNVDRSGSVYKQEIDLMKYDGNKDI